MLYTSEMLENEGALEAARRMCVAARTAPKAKGLDYIKTLAADGAEKDKIAAKMREIAEKSGRSFLARDAGNVDSAQAVVLIGIKPAMRGLNCGLCGFETCVKMKEAGARCAFDGIDLGIALGSAAAAAADARVDTRIMFSIGLAAQELYPDEQLVWHGIPVSVSGKSPFFDRK